MHRKPTLNLISLVLFYELLRIIFVFLKLFSFQFAAFQNFAKFYWCYFELTMVSTHPGVGGKECARADADACAKCYGLSGQIVAAEKASPNFVAMPPADGLFVLHLCHLSRLSVHPSMFTCRSLCRSICSLLYYSFVFLPGTCSSRLSLMRSI